MRTCKREACGKEFEPDHDGHEWCSRSCYYMDKPFPEEVLLGRRIPSMDRYRTSGMRRLFG